MPIKIPHNLPAKEVLNEENIFVIDEERAYHQDIRPIKIVVLNLMPTKIVTETQLLRLLGNTPLQTEITLIHPSTYESKNTSIEHLLSFYSCFNDIKRMKFDGMIITGAPVEQMEFEEVEYWEELKEIFQWTKTNVTSTFHICWGAQAGLYYHYGIQKYPLPQKMFGVFPHQVNFKSEKIVRGFDDEFYVPHSRHTEIRREDIKKVEDIKIISESPESGVYIVISKDEKQIFVTGHSEYDPLTLKSEYNRDISRKLNISVPKNYFPGDLPSNEPIVKWRSHANLLYYNWLNYYVYQETPYVLGDVEK